MLYTKINEQIVKALPDAVVELDDYRHDGLHILVKVTSRQFEGLALLAQHRLVHNALKSLMETGKIHAVKIQTKVPE